MMLLVLMSDKNKDYLADFSLDESKYSFHQLPFFGGRQFWVSTLALGHVGFPFGLSGQGGQAGHVFFPIEIVHGVANHEKMCAATENLHVEDADFALAFNHFGPHMGVDFAVFRDEFGVVDKLQGLAVSFHDFLVLVMKIP
jgi:hypothetical protein